MTSTTRSVHTAVYLRVDESGDDFLFRGSLGESSDSDDAEAIYLVEESDQRRCTMIVDKETEPLMRILGVPQTVASTSSRIIASSPILLNESTHVNLILKINNVAIGKNIVAKASGGGPMVVLARIPVSSQSTVNYSTMQLVDSDIRTSKLTSFDVSFKDDGGQTIHIPPSFYLQIGITLQQMIHAEALR
tara:strand:- start:2144 stop:2713 length:570 start_codon:yes stop_codon:yes gene_type:complete